MVNNGLIENFGMKKKGSGMNDYENLHLENY
jgi:hypothetical protein